jgi:hypothetical protein
MVVGITTTFMQSEAYVIKFVGDLRQASSFLRVFRFPPPNRTDCHDITEILLEVALSTITLTLYYDASCRLMKLCLVLLLLRDLKNITAL